MIKLKHLLNEMIAKDAAAISKEIDREYGRFGIEIYPNNRGAIKLHLSPNLSLEDYNKIVEKLKHDGYAPSYYTIDDWGDPKKYDQKYIEKNGIKNLKTVDDGDDQLTIIFDPIYSKVLEGIDEELYHVTSALLIPKIKKEGFRPQQEGKITKRANARIFFSVCEEAADMIAGQLKDYFPPKLKNAPLALIIIDPNRIPDVKWHDDVNFSYGVYCTVPIPPSAIVSISEIPGS